MADRPKPPRRYKEIEELSPGEHLERINTGRQRFETDEYVEARRKALADAGFEDDADPGSDVESMTPAEHARRKFG
jgi:hypothetical protein